jgi:hypothetical protein
MDLLFTKEFNTHNISEGFVIYEKLIYLMLYNSF